jgi:hypothetical protein
MSKTKIFISSTCYDLSQVRDDIKICIEQLGHEPLLSEYPSFPILPDLGIIENCTKNVRDGTDLFVLIVGGKRGSLDPETNRAVTNIEYETAKSSGIDTFVFVNRTVMNLLPIWEKNQNADFLPHVDNPSVFLFLKNIQADQKWIFCFEKASEITETIKIQMSIFLHELIERKKVGKLTPLKEFEDETPYAQKIALEKPRFWEYLLTEELLRTKLKPVRSRLDDLLKDIVYQKTRTISGRDFFNIISTKCSDMISLLNIIKKIVVEEIPKSWGEPGVSGNVSDIKHAVDNLIDGCKGLLEWESDFISIDPPEPMKKLKELMRGVTSQCIEELERIPDELAKPLREPNPTGSFTIELILKSPPNIEEAIIELQKIKDDPNRYEYWD